ncbi:hypothetical protein CEXT_441551 [Caerostris extrusa]|uniref:Uncharacterized protein n=1 Tax=Caerostris extrusa TaxID=172846 RepID=A0AAV4XNT2_CAEEX|nr:hypothetical protein CEXT_441551 [Caerostris extrusa]
MGVSRISFEGVKKKGDGVEMLKRQNRLKVGELILGMEKESAVGKSRSDIVQCPVINETILGTHQLELGTNVINRTTLGIGTNQLELGTINWNLRNQWNHPCAQNTNLL